jgi:putative transposase
MNVIVQERHRTKEKILDAAMHPVRLLLPTALIEQWCAELGYSWRERVLGPVVTVLACVWKHMQPKVVSARDVEDGIAEWCQDQAARGHSGSDFCQARSRLPEAIFQRAVEHVSRLATQSCARMFHGLRVWLVDGSSVRVPNTQALDAHYGRSTNGTTWSKTPVARLLLLVCAGSSAVLNVLTGAYGDSEQALFLRLAENLAAGGVIVADRAFGSFLQCCRVQFRGSHVLARLRADRQGRKVQRLGQRDKLVEWWRPQPKDSAFPQLLPECPPRIYVRVIERSMHRRGYRSWKLILVTTLIDPLEYPAGELVELYLARWNIETILRTLKTHYGMERVWGKTPDIVEKEIRSTTLAYNCVVALMCQSGEAPELLSPVRARNIVMRCAHYMSHAATCRLMGLFKTMLQLIASALQLPQERAPQPRAILRCRSSYPILKGSRTDWRTNYLAA